MSHESYKDWKVGGYRRPAGAYDADGTPFPLGYTEVVTVVFDGDRRYEVVLDDGGQLSELTIGGSAAITPELLRKLPLGYLAEVARGYVGAHDRAHADGYPSDAALAEGAAAGEQLVSDLDRDGPPTPEEFAAAWRRTPSSIITSEGERITRRQALAKSFSVSVWAIDKWSRAARDRGLISKDRPGAPRGSGASTKKKTRGSRPHSQN